MRYFEYSQTLMGTKVSLQLIEKNDLAAKIIFGSIKMLEDKLTVNREISEVMSINKAAGKHPVGVSPFVFTLIEQAKAISIAKNSCFNVAIGALVKLWKIGFQNGNVPADEQIQYCLLLTNPHLIRLDKQKYTVFLEKTGMEIDLGAIAKGYIADAIKKLLLAQQVNTAIINLGGNVLTVGDSPLSADGYWKIGLQKPFAKSSQPIVVIKIKNKSVVTSGIYERFFIEANQHYHHILDPKTGYPLDNELQSVSVISHSSMQGDIYSTHLYGLGIEKSISYLQETPSLAALFVTKDKKIIVVNIDSSLIQLINKEYVITNHSFG